jgi:hypothetical protein
LVLAVVDAPKKYLGDPRIIDLWDIVNIFSLPELLYEIGMVGSVETVAISLQSVGKGGADGSPFIKTTLSALYSLSTRFEENGLNDCSELCLEAIGHISRPNFDISSCVAYLYTFRQSLLKRLRTRKFLQVKSDRAALIDQCELFGSAVNTAFPSSARDIEEAGNCLAAECCTAAVFHLMRGVEFAVRAVARDRDVFFKDKPLDEKEWGQILGNLETKLKDMGQAGRAQWAEPSVRDQQIRFYAEVVQELRSFNDAWRRHVSHADVAAFYDRDTAIGVFNHVRLFMQKLSSKISESTITPQYWITL